MRAFVIDTDTASDDAVALVMALRHPDIDVKAITIVAGNVGVAQGAKNALYTAELAGAPHVPVYPGAVRPLLRPYMHAHWFHGQDGMGNMDYPAAARAPETTHAVPALIETIRANPGCTLVTLGPLTNVALAVAQAPDIARLVDRCVVMGGTAVAIGNVTPAAEYNIWVDPDAARIVFKSGLPIEMVGWELCRGAANISSSEMNEVRAFGTTLAAFALDCNSRAIAANYEQSGETGLGLPDPVAMAVAIDPTIVTRRSQHYVEVETESDLTRGMTVVDLLGVSNDPRNNGVWGGLREYAPNVQVGWSIDIPRWKALLYDALR